MSNSSDTDMYDDSLRSWMSEPQSLIINWRGWKKGIASNNSSNSSHASILFENVYESKPPDILPLVELAAQAVAKYYPFEYVETVTPPVPDQLHLRIAFWSFPEKEEDIRLYSCLANGSADLFVRAQELVRKKCVKDMLQIGFHLSATVQESAVSLHEVSLSFDRKKIVTCNCTCSNISWCQHVIAVCLYRIYQPDLVKLRSPISESLSRLSRDQMQKFSQYLIAQLPKQALPVAQNLLDEILESRHSQINCEMGAPDPTAGASLQENTKWYLDSSMLHENIRKILLKLCIPSPIVISDVNYLTQAAPPASAEWTSLLRPLRGKEPEGIWNLMAIVREMMKRGDTNAVDLLKIVTLEILDCAQLLTWWFQLKCVHNENTPLIQSNGRGGLLQNSLVASQLACVSLCEEIVVLWRLVCLNPKCPLTERYQYFEMLKSWHIKVLDTTGRTERNYFDRYSGFKPALEACFIPWNNFPLEGIDQSDQPFNPQGIDCNEEDKKSKHHDQQQASNAGPSSQGPQADNLIVARPEIVNENEDINEFLMNQMFAENRSLRRIKTRNSIDRLFEEKHANGFRNYFQSGKLLLRFDCSSASTPDVLYQLTLNKPVDQIDVDFARAEGLHAHGYVQEACKLCVKLAENFIVNPPRISFDMENYMLAKSKKNKMKPSYMRAPSLFVSLLYAKIMFLCSVLSEDRNCHDLAFQIGLYGLQLARPPATIKTLEVKLINQEQDLFALLRNIPLQDKQMQLLRQKAVQLRDGTLPSRGAVLPLMLSSYIFDALVLSATEPQRCQMSVQDRQSSDELLAFQACVVAIGMKCSIPELDFPLLCEGIRRQKSELIITMLFHYRNDEHRLVRIMEKLLDKSVYSQINKQCFMSCVGPCICQSILNCPKCTRFGSNGDKCFVVAGTSRSNYSANYSNADQSANVGYTSKNNNCSRTPSMQPMADPHLVDPYRQWKNAQPLELRNRAFGFAEADTCDSATNSFAPTSGRTMACKHQQQASNNNGANNPRQQHDGNPDVSNNSDNAPQPEHVAPVSMPAHQHFQINHLQDLASCLSCPCLLRESNNLEKLPLSSINAYNAIRSVLAKEAEDIKNHKSIFARSIPHPSKNRYKDARSKADINLCQTIKAQAHLMFELAKTILSKAGGNNSTVELFRQPAANEEENSQRNRLLLVCAFQLGFYSLGLFNSVSSSWCTRNYSSHVSWISAQAVEIGVPAIAFLIATWREHLTPSEVAGIADRASRTQNPEMTHMAARLVLSSLLHASALSINEIKRAILQCKEQNELMFVRALEFIECAFQHGGVNFEVMFEVSRGWYELADTVKNRCIKRKDEDGKKRKKRNQDIQPPPASALPPPPVVYATNCPLNAGSAVHGNNNPAPPNVMPPVVASPVNQPYLIPNPMLVHNQPPSPVNSVLIASHQSPVHPRHPAPFAAVYSNIQTAGPANVSYMMSSMVQPMHHPAISAHAGSIVTTMPNMYGVSRGLHNMPNIMSVDIVSTAPSGHLLSYWPFNGNRSMIANQISVQNAAVPIINGVNNSRRSGRQIMVTPPINQSLGAPVNMVHQAPMLHASVPVAIPTQPNMYQPNPILPPPVMNQPIPTPPPLPPLSLSAPPCQPPTSSPSTSSANDEKSLDSNSSGSTMTHSLSSLYPANMTLLIGHDKHQAQRPMDLQQAYLQKSYQIGLIALEKLHQRVNEEKPRLRIQRFASYGDDVLWLFSVAKRLGHAYVEDFCIRASSLIQSPFVLHDIIDVLSDTLRNEYQVKESEVYDSPLFKPLVHKCQHLYVAYLYYHIHQIKCHEYECFCHGILHAKIIFNMQPEGDKRFDEMLSYMKHAYVNRKKLWMAVRHYFPSEETQPIISKAES